MPQAEQRIQHMQAAFPHALVTEFEVLIPLLQCDPKDLGCRGARFGIACTAHAWREQRAVRTRYQGVKRASPASRSAWPSAVEGPGRSRMAATARSSCAQHTCRLDRSAQSYALYH